MIKTVIAAPDKEMLNDFAAELKKNDFEIIFVDSGGDALAEILNNKLDLVIVNEELCDMTGFQLLEKMVAVNPMINSVVLSSLSKDDFHKATEGLGVLMQLPSNPEKQHVKGFIEYYYNILNLVKKQTRSN